MSLQCDVIERVGFEMVSHNAILYISYSHVINQFLFICTFINTFVNMFANIQVETHIYVMQIGGSRPWVGWDQLADDFKLLSP